MNAYKLATTLIEDGTLVLKDLPFHAGDAVEVIILNNRRKNSQCQHPKEIIHCKVQC